MKEPLIVYAPGSILPVQAALRKGFAAVAPEIAVAFQPPNHSGLLARDILAGGQADIFISANWRYVDDLRQAGLIPHPVVISGNRLILIVRPEKADEIHNLQDLARHGVRILVPSPESDPLGQYIVELFSLAGLGDVIAEKRARGEVADNIGGLRQGLAEGGVDAGVMHANMRGMLGNSFRFVDLAPPFDLRERIVFGAGEIVRGGRAHPAAAAFVRFLIAPEGQSLLVESGFLPRTSVSQRERLEAAADE